MNNDFTSQISAFKAAGCEMVVGNMIPPDFATFWSQAAQQGFKPKIVTIAKALLFPSVVQSLGARGDGLSTEIWWTPNVPFKSSLTGETARQIADKWQKDTGRQWTQPLGYFHAEFEVALEAFKKSGDPKDRAAVRVEPCFGTGVLDQQQGCQSHHLGLGREQAQQQSRQADGLVAESALGLHRLAAGRIPLVEDQVDHRRHGREAFSAFDRPRRLERRVTGADASLGAGDPLLHGRLADHEGAGDLTD